MAFSPELTRLQERSPTPDLAGFSPPGLKVELWEKKRGGGGWKTQTFQITSLPRDQQPGEFQNADAEEGQESHARWKGTPGVIFVDPSLPPSSPLRPVEKQARQHVRAERCFHQVSFPGGCSPTSPLLPTHPAQPAGSASDFRWSRLQGAGNPITFPKGAQSTHQAAKRREGVEQPQRPPIPRLPGPPGQTRAGREKPWTGARQHRGDYLSFRAPRCGPGADVDRAEWQEISQGLPPPRARGQSAPRGRCSRAAHTHIPGSTPHASSLRPAHAPRPSPLCWPHARVSSGPSPRSRPGPCLLGPRCCSLKWKWNEERGPSAL